MPNRRLLLDGPDLQVLLRRAEALGGRVVRAERWRRGLLGRSWYEMTVDVPDRAQPEPAPITWNRPVDPVATPERRRAPAGIGDLLAAAEAAEAAERADVAAGRSARAARMTKGERGG